MLSVYKQFKILFTYWFKRTYFYNFLIRFKFGLNFRPASFKERYEFFPWKKFFKNHYFLYFPANTKKIYWFWFSVKQFYTPPTKKFVAPSIIMQTYFPEYDILQDEVITNAWKAVNAHYYMIWQREFYWYKSRARFAEERTWTPVGPGFYPRHWWDNTLGRRPLKYKYIPSWELVKLLAALDLLWWKMPTEKRWKLKLKERLFMNKRLNSRLDHFGFIFHIVFWYPWKIAYEWIWKFIIGQSTAVLTMTIVFLKNWRVTWRTTAWHRRGGFRFWKIRSLVIFLIFTLPSITFTYLLAEFHYLFCQGNPLLWELAGFNSQNWIKYGTEEHRTLLAIITDEPLGMTITFNIILFFWNIAISFSPKLWAWTQGYGLELVTCFLISFLLFCPYFIGSTLDLDWMYDVVPVSSCYVFGTLWDIDVRAYSLTISSESTTLRDVQNMDKRRPRNQKKVLKMTGRMPELVYDTIPYLIKMYENPAWKRSSGNFTNDIKFHPDDISSEEGAVYLSAYVADFKRLSFHFRTAYWRKRHRYFYYFAEKWIERNNLKEKDPKKFLEKWFKGLQTFWDDEMDNIPSLYEWENFGRDPEVRRKSTFTKLRKKHLYENYLNFWEFFIENVTNRIDIDKKSREYNQEFANILSAVDGEKLGPSDVLGVLFNNKDFDVFHSLYFDSFRLQQAILNEDLINAWEEGRLLSNNVWTKDQIMSDFIQRGFHEAWGTGKVQDDLNKRFDYHEDVEAFKQPDEDNKSPLYGPNKHAFSLNPHLIRFNSELMNIVIYDTPREKALRKLHKKNAYDRRRPPRKLYKKDWALLSHERFYEYFAVRIHKLRTYVKIRLLEKIITKCLLPKKRSFVRTNVVKELFMLKYINCVYPWHLFHIFSFINIMEMDRFKQDFIVDVENLDFLLTKTDTLYSSDDYSNQDLYKKEADKHIETLDAIINRDKDASGIESYWNNFKKTDKAWLALQKEKTYTEKIYEDFLSLAFESHSLRERFDKKLISSKNYAKFLRIFAMRMDRFIKRKNNLDFIKELNEEHFFYTKHYDIRIGLHKSFLGRYEFPKVTMKPKSGYLDILYAWKNASYSSRLMYWLRDKVIMLLKFLINIVNIKGHINYFKKARLAAKKKRERDAIELEISIAKARKAYNAAKKLEARAQELHVDTSKDPKTLKNLTKEEKEFWEEKRRGRWDIY